MSKFIADLSSKALGRYRELSAPIRLLAIVSIGVADGLVLLWLANRLTYYFLAQSYSEEIAEAYDLNRGMTRALVWVSFAAIVMLASLSFSLSRKKRVIGAVGAISLLITHSVVLGMREQNFDKSGQAAKCYVLTRSTIKILNRTGVDPETGRECRALTPAILEKIEAYNRGKRPTLITATQPAFYDTISGEPIVWYAKEPSGKIQLFDLMGYHPRTAAELLPVDNDTIAVWTSQNEKVVRRLAVRVDPDVVGFFDPLTGGAKIWFWRSQSGDFEFYDGPGFHPKSGEPFSIITPEVIALRRAAIEAAAAKKRAEQEQRERDVKERAERAANEAREAAEKSRIEQQAAFEANQQRQKAGADCDRLAANRTDARRASEGVGFDTLRQQADEAIAACSRATALFPEELRYQYQLGRALEFRDRKKAFEIYGPLIKAGYPAAFDNLGSMYLRDRNDKQTAIQLFKRGYELNDADSMVSLADLVEKGALPTTDPFRVKLDLLKRAAELGHSGAQRAYDVEAEKARQLQIQQANQQQMLELMGGIIGGAMRR